MTAPAAPSCPRCNAAASGNFCANCGAPLAATCRQCDTQLTPGANFCHRCGAPAPISKMPSPAGEPRGFSPGLPWGIAVVAFVALVALVVGQRFGARTPGGLRDLPQ